MAPKKEEIEKIAKQKPAHSNDMTTMQRLTANAYLRSIGDKTKLRKRVLLTPIPWIASAFAKSSAPKEWASNKSQLFKGIRFGGKITDLVLCLPGASMGLITMEEAIAAGASDFIFVGTAASIDGKIPFGEVRYNGSVSSILNPFQEHEAWGSIRDKDTVDMEVTYLQALAKKRKVSFTYALIISDAIWKDHWEHPENEDTSYHQATKKSLIEISKWIGRT